MMELYNFYSYAFLKTPTAALEIPIGIAGEVFLINGGNISALVEAEVSLSSLQNDDQQLISAVLSHDRVICEIFRQTTILPLRFGTSFVSQEKLLLHLEAHQNEYLEKIHELKGKAEYILKFTPRKLEEPAIPSEVGGKQYFLAKKQRYQNQQDFYILQTAEWENVVHLITDIHKSAIIFPAQGEDARIFLLVNQTEENLLKTQFRNWQRACPRWELQLGEALPPYHFI
ncbi:GvpL/GvpF family gas vesicle protein [Floridanema evergladense]|uniref:GvpL/GvpF family gas vesicle protein n=1 Tax=Floridaenema evergladense BLCC-F167 TaxID=3153639 RepID=A0ABV4WVD0_9CYAN